LTRHLVLGNGSLLVNFDDTSTMRDLYYPRVGLSNHIDGRKNVMGIWVDGQFAWLDGEGWRRTLGYVPGTMMTEIKADNERLGIRLHMFDAVHYRDNIYIRKVTVYNYANYERECRLFFTHDFSIDEVDIGDTAVYEPEANIVYHYKRERYFLINGQTPQGGMYQFATGVKRFHGAEGTWRDAEDGELQGNPITQGSVDSTVSFSLKLPAQGNAGMHYWIAIGEKFSEIQRLNEYVLERTPPVLMERIEIYWRNWLGRVRLEPSDLPDETVEQYKKSLYVIRTQTDRAGAIIAANDTDILQYNRDHYSYMWPRDGALVSRVLIASGYTEMAKSFFDFCSRAITSRGFMLHKYNPDGSAGSSWHPWWRDGKAQLPIQEDETALVLVALYELFERESSVESILPLYRPLVQPAADFMCEYVYSEWDLPKESHDLWEERRGIFTFTASSVYAGLIAASKLAMLFGDVACRQRYEQAANRIRDGILKHLYDSESGRFLRGVHVESGGLCKDFDIESSMGQVWEFGVLPPDDHRVVATMKAIEDALWIPTAVGGFARYQGDYYFRQTSDPNIPGNPWFITTLWVANWYIAVAKTRADLVRPRELIEWVQSHSLSTGLLPEQLHAETGEPMSVSPLTWSHAAHVDSVLRYTKAWSCLS